MSFTLIGNATDLDFDTANLPTVTAQVLAPWTSEDGTLRTSHATGTFDATGVLTKDDGGPWVIGAPEAAPMYLKAASLPGVRFPAPADGTTLDLADIYAAHSPLPAPSPTTAYVRGASAYEVAVANGYTGTEAEWLAMLGAVEAHAATHAADGADPIAPGSIGAAATNDPRLRDTGPRLIAVSNTNHPGITGYTLHRAGPLVTASFTEAVVSATGSGLSTLGFIPQGFRPTGVAVGSVINGQAGTPADAAFYVSNGGSLVLYRASSTRHAGSVQWLTTDPFPAEPYPGTPTPA